MKVVNFDTVKVGDLVEVPRTQFAPMRRGWNGWLFSEAVVIQKGISAKNRRKVIKVEIVVLQIKRALDLQIILAGK